MSGQSVERGTLSVLAGDSQGDEQPWKGMGEPEALFWGGLN